MERIFTITSAHRAAAFRLVVLGGIAKIAMDIGSTWRLLLSPDNYWVRDPRTVLINGQLESKMDSIVGEFTLLAAVMIIGIGCLIWAHGKELAGTRTAEAAWPAFFRRALITLNDSAEKTKCAPYVQ